MASNSGPSLTTTASSTTSFKVLSNESSGNNASSGSNKTRKFSNNTSVVSVQPSITSTLDDDNEQASSSDEWGMDLGNLIIDLDADLEKEMQNEMKEKNGNAKSGTNRNSNNNNSIKGSNNNNNGNKTPSLSQSQTTSGSGGTACSKNDISASSKTAKIGASGNASTSQAPTKNKTKTKKTNKASTNSKQNPSASNVTSLGSQTNLTPGRNDNIMTKQSADRSENQPSTPCTVAASFASTSTSTSKNVATNSQEITITAGSKSSGKTQKSGRGHKKHNKSEKKSELNAQGSLGAGSGKESREKSSKAKKHPSALQPTVSSATSASHSLPAFMITHTSTIFTTATASKGKNSNPPYNSNMHFKFHDCSPEDYAQNNSVASTVSSTQGKHCNENIHGSAPSFRLPSTQTCTTSTSSSQSSLDTTTSLDHTSQSTADSISTTWHYQSIPSGKRDRGSAIVTSFEANKKIKLEKDSKAPINSVTPNETASVSRTKATEFSTAETALLSRSSVRVSTHSRPRDSVNTPACGNRLNDLPTPASSSSQNNAPVDDAGQTRTDVCNNQLPYRCSMDGRHATSADPAWTYSRASAKPESIMGIRRSVTPPCRSTNPSSIQSTKPLKSASASPTFANNSTSTSSSTSCICGDADGTTSKRTVGTLTTYADVGVVTEPESLGPCEPGSSVHLDGIVWHETESGVLVVNVTWRNRTYVGTLLDATKHDWAPPRYPDIDGDVDFRVKSGRPKRQRGGNGCIVDSSCGRKGKKSTPNNNNGDEYKNSPSSSKRRSAKMSESDAYSGNDGEICTTPSKSAKRPRMSSARSASKQAKQRNSAAGSASASKDSASGTSGSGSSACSSPVFMECPHANCKKRYKNSNALKYHEVHAHFGEDASGAEEAEKSGQDVDSPVAESPKDSDNLSKSPEEGSELGMSPNLADGNQQAEDISMEPSESVSLQNAPLSTMDTKSTTSLHVPFVVTQSGQYNVSSYSNKKPFLEENKFPVVSKEEFEYKTPSSQSPCSMSNQMIETAVQQTKMNVTSEKISLYDINDNQSSASISLKSSQDHQSPRSPVHYQSTSAISSYDESVNSQSRDHSLGAEFSSVDSESAQAVKTLLQLQANQDQLPGLTPYNQDSQPVTMASVNQDSQGATSHFASEKAATPASSASYSMYATTMAEFPPKKSIMTSNSTMSSSIEESPSQVYRNNGSNLGTMSSAPLPRMSVGISSMSNTNTSPSVNNQYLVSLGGFVSHPHGTVTTIPCQEGGALYTSSGVKMAKGKTVPIPTDPHQIPTPAGAPTLPSGGSVNSKKSKQKRKKGESGKVSHSQRISPTEPLLPPTLKSSAHNPLTNIYKDENNSRYSSFGRLKQEPGSAIHPVSLQGPLSYASESYNKMPVDAHISHGSNPPLSQSPAGLIKSDSHAKSPSHTLKNGPLSFTQPGVPISSRKHSSEYQEHGGSQHEHSRHIDACPGNKNNNNKMIPISSSSEHVPINNNLSPAFSDISDTAASLEIKDAHGVRRSSLGDGRIKTLVPSATHSLPGSRSLTPVGQVPTTSQANYKTAPQTNSDGLLHTKPSTSSLPFHQETSVLRKSQGKDSSSPAPTIDKRICSIQIPDAKSGEISLVEHAFSLQQQRPHAPYGSGFPYGHISSAPAGYEYGMFQAQYTHPQFRQHFEHVIQQEIKKGGYVEQQRIKEEPVASHPQVSSPALKEQSKVRPVKCSPSRGSGDGRRSRDLSPSLRSQHQGNHRYDARGERPVHVSTQHGTNTSLQEIETRTPSRASPAPVPAGYPSTPHKPRHITTLRGISPHPQHTSSPLVGSRPPRPSSEIERAHRREPSLGEVSGTPNPMPLRKPTIRENFSDQLRQAPSPDKKSIPPASVYASPTVPVQTIPPGARPPVQFYPYPFDPNHTYRNLPQFGFSPVPGYIYPGPQLFPHGPWPQGHPAHPPVPDRNPEKAIAKSTTERSTGGTRSPFCDDGGRRTRSEIRTHDTVSYPSSKERPTSEGISQVRKSVTPDNKALPVRNLPNASSASPPTQRHLHTHHHIHEAIPILPPQYQYTGSIPPIPAAVIASSEAGVLAPFTKREQLS